MSLALPTPTVQAPAVSLPAAFRALRAGLRRERLLTVTGLAHAALLPLFAAPMLVDARTVLDENVWLKPAKFAASIAIYTLTVALLLGPLPEGRARAWARWTTAAPLAGEMAIIALQAARGVRSHFNDDSGLDAALFAAMGVMILVATAGAVVLLVMHLRDRGLSPALAAGVRAGIALSLLGSVVGGAMSGMGQHTVGAEDGAGEKTSVTGWSADHGDLRVAHFAGLHALQVLPLLGLVVAARAPGPSGARWVWAAAGAYALLVAALFAQALAGMPLAG
jgi:hypothetical protein